VTVGPETVIVIVDAGMVIVDPGKVIHSVEIMVLPVSIVIPSPSAPTPDARVGTSGDSTYLGIVAGTVGMSVGIDPSTPFVDSAMAVVAHSERKASENLIVDLSGKPSRTASRPSVKWC
jgi:hypothetical protein